MTISTQTRTVLYDGNGVATVFAYPFKIFASTDLKVYLRNVVTGGFDLQTLTTHYSVSGVGNPGGGNIAFVTAPASGLQTVFILRKTALTQLIDYVTNDDFPAEVHEGALDKLTAAIQDWIGDALAYDPLTDRWDFQNRQSRRVPLPFAADGVASKAYVDQVAAAGDIRGYVSSLAQGTGAQTVFPLAVPPTMVYINGVYQNQNTYTAASGNVTFSEAPPANSTVEFLI